MSFASLLAARLDLTPPDLGAHRELALLDPTAPLPSDRDDAWHALLSDPDIRERIAERAEARHELLVEYLDCWDLLSAPIAFVDVGWRGQLAWLVSAVIAGLTGHQPVHLHFGGANVITGLDDAANIRRFAVDDSVAPLPFPQVVSCVETFTASGAPRVERLSRTAAGDVDLVFDTGSPLVANAARTLLWDSAEQVAAALPSHATLERWGLRSTGMDAAVRDILTTFWTHPTRTHAVAASQLGYEVDDAGTIVGPVANPYHPREMLVGHAPDTREWRQGSLALTWQPFRSALTTYFALADRRH